METAFKAIIGAFFIAILFIGGFAAALAFLISGLIAGICIAIVVCAALLAIATIGNFFPGRQIIITESNDAAHGDIPHVNYRAAWPTQVTREAEPRGA